MKEKLIKWKFYFDKDKEEQWLNEMAAKGWSMKYDIIEILDRTHVVVKHDRTLPHSQHICRIPLCRHSQCRQTEEYNNAKFLHSINIYFRG